MEYKFYKDKDKENRDPNIYLGIDDTPIPIHYFKNIEIIAGNVYGEKIDLMKEFKLWYQMI